MIDLSGAADMLFILLIRTAISIMGGLTMVQWAWLLNFSPRRVRTLFYGTIIATQLLLSITEHL